MKWIRPDNIGLLKRDMELVTHALEYMVELPDGSPECDASLMHAERAIQHLHQTLAGWELLLSGERELLAEKKAK